MNNYSNFVPRKSTGTNQFKITMNNYLRLGALALGTFALGMAEFSMMGILSEASNAMDISISRGGDFISFYSLGVAVGAPMLLFLRNYRLARVLSWLCVMILIGNALSAAAQSYGMLVAARFISGLPHGAYFGTAAIVAARIVPPGKGAEAVAIMVAGMSVATVAGVPLSTLMSELVSWRLTFVISAAVAALGAVCIRLCVPRVQLAPVKNISGQFAFLRHAAPWMIFAATFLGQGSIYCWYSYVEPCMRQIAGFTPGQMTWVMMVAGMGFVVGGLASGRLSDRFSPSKVTCLVAAFTIVLLPSIYLFAADKAVSVVLMFLATACLFGIGGPLQYLIIKFAKGGEMLGGAGIQVAFNTSNACSAAIGGAVIHAGYSLAAPALVGIPLAVAATGVLWGFHHKYRDQERA